MVQLPAAPGPDRVLRPPIGYDIVVHLAAGGDLDQLDMAGTPVADRLDPQSGPALVARLEIAIVGKVALALHQPETARPMVEEGENLQRLRMGQRSPQPLAATGQHGEAVRIMDRGPVIVEP